MDVPAGCQSLRKANNTVCTEIAQRLVEQAQDIPDATVVRGERGTRSQFLWKSFKSIISGLPQFLLSNQLAGTGYSSVNMLAVQFVFQSSFYQFLQAFCSVSHSAF